MSPPETLSVVRRLIGALCVLGGAAVAASAQAPTDDGRPVELRVEQRCVGVGGSAPAPAVAPPVGDGPVPNAPLAAEPEPTDAAAPGCAACAGAVGPLGRPRRCLTCGHDADLTPPLGCYVHAAMQRQAELARDNLFVIGLWEWIPTTTLLTVGGERRLAWIVWRLDHADYPIKVQPGPDEALNEARKAQIVAVLEQHGLADAAARVVIAPSTGEGLRYDEIERVGQHVLIGAGAYGTYGAGPSVPFGGTPVGAGGPAGGIAHPY